MPDEQLKEPAAPPVSENPHLENVPDVPVAPNLENELEAALNKAFESNDTEPKAPEKVETDKPKESKESKAEKPKKNSDKPAKEQGELPKPEDLDLNPPKNQEGWTSLKNKYKQVRDLAYQREQEINKLKAGLAEKTGLSQKEIEALRKENQELSKYRTMVDIQADPEFVSKFDQPIEKSKNAVKEMLLGLNVDPKIVEQIDYSNIKLMDQIIGHVAEHSDKITAKRLERKVEEIADLMDKRNETLSSQKTAYQEFMEAKKKESSLKGAEEEGRTLKHLETIAAAKDNQGNNLFPFLTPKQVADGASESEIAQASNHNRMVELMQAKINQAIKLSSPEEKAELAVAAVSAHYLQAQLKAAVKKISGLEEELKKISIVSDESEKSKPRAPRNGASLDLDSALSSHFTR